MMGIKSKMVMQNIHLDRKEHGSMLSSVATRVKAKSTLRLHQHSMPQKVEDRSILQKMEPPIPSLRSYLLRRSLTFHQQEIQLGWRSLLSIRLVWQIILIIWHPLVQDLKARRAKQELWLLDPFLARMLTITNCRHNRDLQRKSLEACHH